MSQRQLANSLGVSVGKTNYSMRALVERGLVKARFTRPFFERKHQGYEMLRIQIADLELEIGAQE